MFQLQNVWLPYPGKHRKSGSIHRHLYLTVEYKTYLPSFPSNVIQAIYDPFFNPVVGPSSNPTDWVSWSYSTFVLKKTFLPHIMCLNGISNKMLCFTNWNSEISCSLWARLFIFLTLDRFFITLLSCISLLLGTKLGSPSLAFITSLPDVLYTSLASFKTGKLARMH